MALHLKLVPAFEGSEADTTKDTTIEKPKSVFSTLKSKFIKQKKKPVVFSMWTEDKLFPILNDFLQPDTTRSLDETFKAIMDLLPQSTSVDTDVWAAGTVILELAEQIPYSHPSQLKLARLVDTLSLTDRFNYRPDERGVRYRCTRLGDAMCDAFDGPNPDIPNEWPNLSAFYAHLEACHIHPYRPSSAIQTLRSAFEERMEDEEDYFQGMKDQSILAAAQYILWSGNELFKAVSYAGDVEESDQGAWHPGPLYDGDWTLNLQRWRFWKGGFEAAVQDESLGEEARDVADRAAKLMGVFESTLVF
ncbi:hypothetical protein BJX99DRAFT_258066 [Aspergillus californicus]